MTTLPTFRLQIIITLCLGTVFMYAQTPCDTIFALSGKKIPARDIVIIKDEVKYAPCRGDLKNEIYVPVNQIKGFTSNGIFTSVQNTIIEKERKEKVIMVDEKDTSVNALLRGRILLGLTASTPNPFALSGQNSAGVQFGKNLNSGSDSDITVINISPSVGYSPINHMLVGIATNYSNTKVEEITMTAISISPFVRGYYPGNNKFMPFAEVGWHFISSNIGEIVTQTGSGFTGKLGTSFFFNRFISLDLFGAYQYSWQKREIEQVGTNEKYTFSQLGLGIGFSVFLN